MCGRCQDDRTNGGVHLLTDVVAADCGAVVHSENSVFILQNMSRTHFYMILFFL